MPSLLQIRFQLTARGEPEAEGMTAAKTNVFGPLSPNLVEGDEVAQYNAAQRVPDHVERSLCLDERVPTPARIFSCFRSRSHNVNAMAKEPADVINFLPEFIMAGIRVAGYLEKQRVSTPFADVLIVGCAPGHRHVVMPAEKAGKRVSNS